MEKPFPYEYGSDLHWLWGWGQRIEDSETVVTEPNRYAGMYFRPDRLAQDAIAEFTVDFGPIVRQIQDYSDHAEKHFSTFLEDPSEDTWMNFCIAIGDLKDRIFKGCEVICSATKNKRDRWSLGAKKSKWKDLNPSLTDKEFERIRTTNQQRVADAGGNGRGPWKFRESLCSDYGLKALGFTDD